MLFMTTNWVTKTTGMEHANIQLMCFSVNIFVSEDCLPVYKNFWSNNFPITGNLDCNNFKKLGMESNDMLV